MILGEKIKYYRQHWFIRNVATLQIGTFAGTVFQAGVGIFLARLLQPELFGVYSLSIGLASLAGVLLGAGMQDAVSTLAGAAYAQNNEEELGDVLAFLLKITLYAALITLVVFLFLPNIAGYFYDNPSIGWYAGIVMLAVFFSTSFNAATQLSLQAVGKIRILAGLVFSDQFLRFSASLILVFIGYGVLGGVTGQLIGALAVFSLSLFIWTRLVRKYNILPTLGNLFQRVRRVSVKKYLGFTFWVAIDRNIGNLYLALPVVLTGIYVSTGEVSFFKLAFGFVNLALSLLGPISILLNMEFPKMQVDNDGRLVRNFMKVSFYGMILSSVLTLAAVVVSPLAFRILYGESFLPSINYVFGLFVYGALYGIGVGLGPMWRALNKVRTSIFINLVILGVGIPFGLWLISNFGNWGAVIMVTLWFTVSHFISFGYILKQLKRRPI